MSYIIVKPDELYHYGILGQKWGVRRFQNPDGSLTEAGKKRYGVTGTTEDDIVYTKKLMKDAKKRKLDFNAYQNSLNEAERTRKEITEPKNKDLIDPEKYDPSKVSESKYGGYYDKGMVNVGGVKADYRISLNNDSRSGPMSKAEAKPYLEAINKFQKSLSKNDSALKDAIADDIYDGYIAKNRDDSADYQNLTREQFKAMIKPYSVWYTKWPNGSVTAEIGYDDGGLLGGHSLDIEIDVKTGKTGYVSVNG